MLPYYFNRVDGNGKHRCFLRMEGLSIAPNDVEVWETDASGNVSGIPSLTCTNLTVTGTATGPFSSVTPAALTKVDDTNVTLTLGGTPSTALLQASSLTLGWAGTLAAARLNSNVVQAITNDTNVTGSISAQNLTLGWTSTLSVARGGIGVGTLAANGVLYGNTTGAVQATAQGAANSVLTANAGAPSFTATPTIGTSVTCPTLIGGTGGTSTLALRSTSGTGAAGADIIFQTGTNGGTEAARILNSGFVGIGISPVTLLQVKQTSGLGDYTTLATSTTYSAQTAIITDLTAAQTNLTTCGLLVDTQLSLTGSPIKNVASLNAIGVVAGTATYNAALSHVAGFYEMRYAGSGSVGNIIAVNASAESTGTGSIVGLAAINCGTSHTVAGSGTTTTVYGVNILTPTSVAGRTFTNTIGLSISSQKTAAGTQTNTAIALQTLGTTDLISFASKFTTYNNIATVSNGVASELAAVDTTGLTANVGATTLYAVPSTGAGMYRVGSLVVETTAGSVTSTLPNVQILYTDKETGGVITIDATPVLGVAGIGQTGALTANTVGTTSTGVIVINAKASTNIQYQTVNYASNAAGMAYALHIKLEAL